MQRLALLLVLPLMVGCVSLNPRAMVIDHGSPSAHPIGTVAVNVDRGSPEVALYSGTIGPTEFAPEDESISGWIFLHRIADVPLNLLLRFPTA